MCFRWIEDLRVLEDFVGYYELKNKKSDTIVTTIKDSLIKMQLSLNDLRAQAYDGLVTSLAKILVFLSKLQLNTKSVIDPLSMAFVKPWN